MKKSNYRGARLLMAAMSLLIGVTQCSEAGALDDQLENEVVALKSGTADGGSQTRQALHLLRRSDL